MARKLCNPGDTATPFSDMIGGTPGAWTTTYTVQHINVQQSVTQHINVQLSVTQRVNHYLHIATHQRTTECHTTHQRTTECHTMHGPLPTTHQRNVSHTARPYYNNRCSIPWKTLMCHTMQFQILKCSMLLYNSITDNTALLH